MQACRANAAPQLRADEEGFVWEQQQVRAQNFAASGSLSVF